MKISQINNTFSGRIQPIAKLAKKAEKRLQKRLTNPVNLMLDIRTNTIYDRNTGKIFTGKFGIFTDKLEQFFHIKNGKLYATLVRDVNGNKKVGGFGIGRMKLWTKNPDLNERIQIAALSSKRDDIYESMMHNWGIKKCIENGTDTFIGSRGF